MKRQHHLSNVNVERLSLVTKGANRKRFFMRKAEGGDAGEVALTSGGRLVKAADWSAVYCVVAEPGWEEGPGLGDADQSIPDVWVSEDEIRKAAHRFMKNGGLVNRMHESIDPYGAIVENAIALDDFEVDGETIKKGSWYVAIEPTVEGRAAIEKGEFGGVSIEGTGTRILVTKRAPTPNTGSLGSMKGLGQFLRKLGERSGMSDDDLALIDADLTKAATFGERMAARELDEELPNAFEVLRDVVWSAFYLYDDDDVDPESLIKQSLQEFQEWAVDLVNQVGIAKGAEAAQEVREKVAKSLGVDPSKPIGVTLDSEMGLNETERQEFDGLKDQVAALPTEEKIGEIVKAALEDVKPAEDEPTAESVTEAVGELKDAITERFEKVEADLKKLGAGGSSQPKPTRDPERVEKSEPEHAGIL